MSTTDLRALVVDDDAIARKMLAFALEREGFSCDAAVDGLQAQAKIAQRSYDLVVTDLRMPNKHGHSLAKDLLQRESRPVIMIHTSVDDPRLTKDLMARGVDDIMYKPVQPAAFAAKARSLVARRRTALPSSAGPSHKTNGSQHPVHAASQDPPRDFGRYRILREIGRGNMATVYLAEDTRLEREVALKIVLTDGCDRGAQFRRFQEEAKAAATLSHPGICPVYDLGTIDGRHYIAMAYIQGHALSHYIDPYRLQPQRKAALVILKLARALEHAHRRGIVHRDLKPSNIIVSDEGQPVITDFGLAWRMGHADIRLTQSGQLVGTPAYMSPEQANSELENIGPPSDIYSLGVILYQLLTGRLPFEGSVAKVIYQIISEDPKPPSSYRPDVDPRLEQLCLKMLAKPIDQRPASMAAVADTIARLLTETGR